MGLLLIDVADKATTRIADRLDCEPSGAGVGLRGIRHHHGAPPPPAGAATQAGQFSVGV